MKKLIISFIVKSAIFAANSFVFMLLSNEMIVFFYPEHKLFDYKHAFILLVIIKLLLDLRNRKMEQLEKESVVTQE